MNVYPYTEGETAALIKMFRAKKSVPEIAHILNRSVGSVATKVAKLRINGDLPSYQPGLATGNLPPDKRAVSMEAGIKLGNDNLLVDRCLAEGGFPEAVTLPGGRTFWVTPQGQQWQHRTVQKLVGRRMAA